MNLSEFLFMGGYGAYVWGSYGFAVVVLIFNVIAAVRKKKTATKIAREMSKLSQSETS